MESMIVEVGADQEPDVLETTSSEEEQQFKQETESKAKKIVATFREFLSNFKRMTEDRCVRYGFRDDVEGVRVYHVWPGNNVFFFGGRLICGPDPRGSLLTMVSIILSRWSFAVDNGDDSMKHSHLIVTFATILAMIVLVILFLVSTIDPGIIPRNHEALVDEDARIRSRVRRRVVIHGVELKLKYCRICKIYRPPRSCHCAVCDNCVERFDHHCPWIGQCIGLRNYRFYLTFVLSALAFFSYIFAFSCKKVRRMMSQRGSGMFMVLRSYPETLALLLFSFAAIGLLTGLACSHMYLIARNQTGYENYHEHYASSANPFDKGFLSNVKVVILAPTPPSRIDFRAELTEDVNWERPETCESNC